MPRLRIWFWVIGLWVIVSRVTPAVATPVWLRDPILSQLLVKQMVTDRLGFRWIAANEGLYRYDGYDLIPLRQLIKTPQKMLLDRTVWHLVLDRKGRLWLGAEQGLFCFNPQTGELRAIALPPVPKSNRDGIAALFLHPKSGRLWVGYESSVVVLDPEHPERPLGPPRQVGGGPLYFQPDGTGAGVWLSLRQPNWPARRIYTDASPPGVVQLATTGAVRRRFTTDCFVMPLPGTNPLQICSASALFSVTTDGRLREIQRWLPAGNEDNFLPLGAGADTVREWVSQGHRMRLSVRNRQVSRVIVDTLVLGANTVDHRHSYVLEQDPLGVQWCYSQFWRGCYKQLAARRRVVQPLRMANGRPTPSARAIMRLPDGRLLLGAYGGPLVQAADSPNAPLRPLLIEQDGAASLPLGYDLLTTRSGRVFFCQDSRGFSEFDPRANALCWLPYAESPAPAHGHTLFEDHLGQLWAGTSHGLFRLRPDLRRCERFSRGATARRLAALEIRDIVEDLPSGDLWLATAKGLYLLNPQTGFLQVVGDSSARRPLPSEDLLSVAIESTGRVWVGTNADGLLLVDRNLGLVRQLGLADGMPSRTVATVLSRPDGSVWAGTFAGLVRYDPATQRLAVLTEADGLIDAEMNRNSAYADPSTGVLWFGGVGGLHRVREKDIGGSGGALPANLLVTAVVEAADAEDGAGTVRPVVNNKIPVLELEAGPSAFVELQLALSNLLTPDQTHYAYRLLRPNGQLLTPWLPTTRRLVLRGVAAGEYRVEVRAETVTGQAATNTVRVALQVARAWWQHPLTWIAGGGALILLGYFIFWLQGLRARRDARLRQELAANLHDEVGALLTKISLMAEVLQHQPTPVPANSHHLTGNLTGRLLRSSRDAVQAMRDVVWSIDSRADSVPALLDRMRDFLDQMAPSAGLEYVFETEEQARLRPLRPVVRKQLYLIFKEAVTNVLRHAKGATLLHVRLEREGGGFVLEIIDNGQQASQVGKSGLGLRNMVARAKTLNGQLQTGPRADGQAGFQVKLWVKG